MIKMEIKSIETKEILLITTQNDDIIMGFSHREFYKFNHDSHDGWNQIFKDELSQMMEQVDKFNNEAESVKVSFNLKDAALKKHFDIQAIESCMTCPHLIDGKYDENNCVHDLIIHRVETQICNQHPKHPNFKNEVGL
jgi:hypothetical protein